MHHFKPLVDHTAKQGFNTARYLTCHSKLINHHKLVAGAEGLWKDLRKFIRSETDDFNDQTRPDFFKVTESEDGFHIDVVAPMASLKCWFDNRVPNVKPSAAV